MWQIVLDVFSNDVSQPGSAGVLEQHVANICFQLTYTGQREIQADMAIGGFILLTAIITT